LISSQGDVWTVPLNAIGLFAAAVETLLFIWLSFDKHGAADRAIY
jgi:hypothetical protein